MIRKRVIFWGLILGLIVNQIMLYEAKTYAADNFEIPEFLMNDIKQNVGSNNTPQTYRQPEYISNPPIQNTNTIYQPPQPRQIYTNNVQNVTTPVYTQYNNYQNYSRVKIPAGTAISIYVEREIDADDVVEGQTVDFIVQYPVKVNNITVINSGTRVTGQITKKRNNFILGIPGEIQIGNFKLYLQDGNIVTLRGESRNKGEGRYWGNIGWIMVWPLLFVKGADGKIPAGTSQVVYTNNDAYVEVNQSY